MELLALPLCLSLGPAPRRAKALPRVPIRHGSYAAGDEALPTSLAASLGPLWNVLDEEVPTASKPLGVQRHRPLLCERYVLDLPRARRDGRWRGRRGRDGRRSICAFRRSLILEAGSDRLEFGAQRGQPRAAIVLVQHRYDSNRGKAQDHEGECGAEENAERHQDKAQSAGLGLHPAPRGPAQASTNSIPRSVRSGTW